MQRKAFENVACKTPANLLSPNISKCYKQKLIAMFFLANDKAGNQLQFKYPLNVS